MFSHFRQAKDGMLALCVFADRVTSAGPDSTSKRRRCRPAKGQKLRIASRGVTLTTNNDSFHLIKGLFDE